MNENIDLINILKDCPSGISLWSDNYGDVKFMGVHTEYDNPIEVMLITGQLAYYTKEGWWNKKFPANCLLWPSKDCRDWSKFTSPLKKEKFDPKTLKPFDKVIVRDRPDFNWHCEFFSYMREKGFHRFVTTAINYNFCIPYNDDTMHLIGKNEEAPEYYRYWDD